MNSGADGGAVDFHHAESADHQHQHQQHPVKIAKGDVSARRLPLGSGGRSGIRGRINRRRLLLLLLSWGWASADAGGLRRGRIASGWAISWCDSVAAAGTGLSLQLHQGQRWPGFVHGNGEATGLHLVGRLGIAFMQTAATSACLPDAAFALATCVWQLRRRLGLPSRRHERPRPRVRHPQRGRRPRSQSDRSDHHCP